MCFNLVSAVDHNSESEENMQNSLSTNCELLSIVIGSFTVLVDNQFLSIFPLNPFS